MTVFLLVAITLLPVSSRSAPVRNAERTEVGSLTYYGNTPLCQHVPVCHSGLDPESSPALILLDSRLHGNDVIINDSKDSDLTDTALVKRWSPSPTGATLRSLVFPGWGQAYNRAPLKAVIYGGIEQALIYSIYQSHRQFRFYKQFDDFKILAENHRDNRNRLTWYLAGAIVMSMMDAFVDAHLYHFDVSEDLSHVPVENGFLNSGVNITIGWIDP